MSLVAGRGAGRMQPPAAVVAAGDEAAAAAAPAGVYIGLVTRALAFALDAAVINLVAILTAAVVTLAASVVTVHGGLKAVAIAIAGAAYVLWTIGYFVTFWATTGQTPGNRVMRIRVTTPAGQRLRPRRALVRFAGLTLAALPLGAGFLLILVDDRRRGLHDLLARTVVVDAREPEPAERPGRRSPR